MSSAASLHLALRLRRTAQPGFKTMSDANQNARYVPTPEQIAEAAAEVRKGWKKQRAPKPLCEGVYAAPVKLHSPLSKSVNPF